MPIAIAHDSWFTMLQHWVLPCPTTCWRRQAARSLDSMARSNQFPNPGGCYLQLRNARVPPQKTFQSKLK